MEMQENQDDVKIEEDKKKEEIMKDYSSTKKKKKKGGKDKNQKVLTVGLIFVAIFSATLIYGLWNMKIINKTIKESVYTLEKYKVKKDLITIVKGNPVFAGSEYAKKIDASAKEVDLYDLIDIEENLAIERDRIIENYTRYEAPYKYLLQYIYLPRLNVWKNPFTKNVSINLFGKNYIDANPYVDTKLLEKWSSFFVENNHDDSRNDIKTIRIDDLDIDDKDNSFSIPMNVSVKVDDRRTFLDMLSKLTMTANTKTVMDINEFTYYLWEALVEDYEKFAVSKHKEYKDARSAAMLYEDNFLKSDNYVLDKDGEIDLKEFYKFIKADKDLTKFLQSSSLTPNTKNQFSFKNSDTPYMEEWKFYLFFLRKKFDFSYEELENIELYLQDIENWIENIDTPAIESEYNPIYLVYLYKMFDSYKEEELVNETKIEKADREKRDILRKEQEMAAIKNDINPIYKFVWMRFYSWAKNCKLEYSDELDVINKYDSCNNHIIIKPSVIAKAIYTYAYGWRFSEFEWENLTEDVSSIFRENMKDIPYIQYSLWKYNLTKKDIDLLKELEILKDKKNKMYDIILQKKNDGDYSGVIERKLRVDWALLKGLHDIYNSIPPLIKIGNFNFAQLKNNSIYWNGYDVNLNMSVYGQGIAEEEIVEIQEEIGVNCGMEKSKKFTIDIAIERVEKHLEKLYNNDIKNNSEYVYDLKTLLDIFKSYNDEYEKKSRFDKIIVLLESYRMLNERWYCEVEEKPQEDTE